MDSIPKRLQPLVTRLESVPDLSRKQLISILFCVRLGDALHRSFHGSFLTLSLLSKLCNHLEIPSLFLEIEVFVMQWSYNQGQVAVSHRISFDYDMYTVFRLVKIAKAVLNDTVTPKDGLRLIQEHEKKSDYNKLEAGYRDFPWRALVIPLMSFTCATVYFGGTWFDLGFSCLCGFVAGLVAWIATLYPQLAGSSDYLVAIFTAMISVMSFSFFPKSTCFSAQVMGTLYWFFYGTAFVLSLYEITNNQLLTGLSRFVQATLRSYGLAFGALFGAWLAWFGPDDRLEEMLDECNTKSHQIPSIWFALLFPLSAIACLMQFRVALRHYIPCLIVQAIAYGSQYLILNTWKQPEFIANLFSAYLATLASTGVVGVMNHMQNPMVHHLAVSSKSRSNQCNQEGKSKDDYTGRDEEEASRNTGPVQSAVSLHQEASLVPGEVEMEAPSSIPVISPSSSSSSPRLKQRRVMNCNDEASLQSDAGRSSIPIQQPTQEQNSDTIGFVDASAVCIATDELTYTRSGTWFCLMPALYLLVPGSKILQAGFVTLLGSFVQGAEEDDDYSSLASSLLVIGLGQVIGLRLGFVTAWVCNTAWTCITERRVSDAADIL